MFIPCVVTWLFSVDFLLFYFFIEGLCVTVFASTTVE